MSALVLAFATALVQVPHPDLTTIEPAVAAPLAEARSAIEGGDPDAWGELAQRYLAHEFYPAAAAALENAIITDPEDPRWHHLAGYLAAQELRYPEAVARFEAAVAAGGVDRASRLRLADALIGAGELGEAEGVLDELQREGSPDEAALLAARGRIAAARGEHLRAVTAYESALEVEPEASQLHYLAALSLRAQGLADEAREHARQRGSRPPTISDPLVDDLPDLARNPETYIAAAEYALRYEQLEGASNAIEIALRAHPGSEQAQALKARIDEALAAAAGADPARLAELYRSALRALLAGDCGRSAELLDQGLVAAPWEGVLMNAAARVFATCPELGPSRRERALELARAVYEARPSPEFEETLAMALAGVGRYEEAAERQRALLLAAQGIEGAPFARLATNLQRYRDGRPAPVAWSPGDPVFSGLR